MPKILIQRHRADTNFADTEVEELIATLRETENLEEQGDILQFLVDTQGLDFNTGKLSGDYAVSSQVESVEPTLYRTCETTAETLAHTSNTHTYIHTTYAVRL